jgi:hypothetical protein
MFGFVFNFTASPMPSPMKSSPARTPAVQGPSCQALYDFDPENPGELGFKVIIIRYTVFQLII